MLRTENTIAAITAAESIYQPVRCVADSVGYTLEVMPYLLYHPAFFCLFEYVEVLHEAS